MDYPHYTVKVDLDKVLLVWVGGGRWRVEGGGWIIEHQC